MKQLIKTHDVFGRYYQVPTNKLTFRPSVYGVIIERNRVLLSRQRGGYDFPGGGVDIDETIAQTLKRECWEETGLKVSVGLPIWCSSSFFTFRNHKKSVHAICMYFICKRRGGKLTDKHLVGPELKYVKKAEWVDVERITKLIFYNSLKEDNVTVIKRALAIKKLGVGH